MPCENYREALTEAAAADSAPSRELRLHLDACASCRAAFAQERLLFSSIDSGLRSAANAEVPASLIPRVRTRLNEQRTANRPWVPVGATMAAVAAILMIVIVRGTERERPAKARPESFAASNAPLANVPVLPDVISRSASSSHAARRETIQRGQRASFTRPTLDAEILVPAGQKEAVDALLAGLKEGTVQGSPLVADKIGLPLEDLQVLPLAILPIEIKPLADASEESSPEKRETTR
jgi:hypothetical protein